MSKRILLFIFTTVLLTLTSVAFVIYQNNKTNLQNNNEQYELSDYYQGYTQSPINILSTRAKIKPRDLKVNFDDKITSIENTGHTIKLEFEKGSLIESDGNKYEVKQLHFHTPSEHKIDGMVFPMEMHIVSAGISEKVSDKLLVIGIIFKMGEDNEFIKKFLNHVPEEHHTNNIKKDNLNLSSFFGDLKINLNHFYHYQGSLTTAPYTQNVEWFVIKDVFDASPYQIAKINTIIGNNARHTQLVDYLTLSFQ